MNEWKLFILSKLHGIADSNLCKYFTKHVIILWVVITFMWRSFQVDWSNYREKSFHFWMIGFPSFIRARRQNCYHSNLPCIFLNINVILLQHYTNNIEKRRINIFQIRYINMIWIQRKYFEAPFSFYSYVRECAYWI